MKKFADFFFGAMAWLTGTSLFVCFAVVLVSSLSRYAFNSPFQWSEELAKFAMIYGTMFGAVLSYLSDMQVRFMIAVHLVPERMARAFAVVCHVAAIGLGIVLAVSGYLFMMRRGGIMTSGLGIQMYYPQAAMLIGGVCLFIAGLIKLFCGQSVRSPAQDKLVP